eukprot:scaffold6893_cov104-Phaeocystis_antarctica.AAC.2
MVSHGRSSSSRGAEARDLPKLSSADGCPGAQWSCRNRHQGEGPPERAHTGPGRPKPRYNVYSVKHGH